MSRSQTYELTIFPGPHRDAVLLILDQYAITDFVESAGEVNADDTEWEKVFEEWSATVDAPLVVYRPTREELEAFREHLQREFSGDVRVEEKFLADTLWQEAWEPGFEALETERFFIAEPDREAPPGKLPIRLKKAPVFGSGQHATTQALVRLLEKQGRHEGKRFLDVGTGTGVLCLVARHLGFSEICGTDIEGIAIENARENSALNDLSAEWIVGSLPEEERKWDFIVCNILPPTLTDLIPALKNRLGKEGELYLAGFHEANANAVRERLSLAGLDVRDECQVAPGLPGESSDLVKKLLSRIFKDLT